MKSLKIAIMSITILLSAGIVFAGGKKSESKTTAKSGTVLYWFNTAVNTYQAANTLEDEQSRTGCDGASNRPLCEKGFAQSQLNDPNDPSQGVQSGQEGSPTDIIYVH